MESTKTGATIEFPKDFTIAGNIALAIWLALDTVAFLLYDVAAGVVFLIVALIAVYGVLKFLGCLRPCYNCKKCTYGLGRLAALYFGGRSLKDYKYTYHLPTALFFYTFVGPFPAAFAVFSAIQMFSVAKVIVAALILAFTVYSGVTWLKTDDQPDTNHKHV
jgi:hypothetical protein